MKLEPQLKEQAIKELQKIWTKSPDMVDYCIKTTDYIVPLADNDLYLIEKPQIETSFCFGHGQNGISTMEEEQNARDCENYARTNEQYFIKENLEQVEHWLNDLQNPNYKIYKIMRYYSLCNDNNLKSIVFIEQYQEPVDNTATMILITEEEKQALIEGYQKVKADFTKRLNTYLKRYGLSKLNTWTYLVD